MLPSVPEEPRSPALRASDDDRSQVVDVLRGACADGRITLDEFSDRVGQAYAARTLDELKVVTADLPVPVERSANLPAPSGNVGPRQSRWVIGIMSGGVRKRRWRASGRTNAVAFMGGCHLDLRQAEIEGPEVEIVAVAVMGGIEIIVPEGIEVELSGLAIMGGKECRLKDVPRRPGTPLIRVKAVAFWGGVSIRSKPSVEEEKAKKADRSRDRQTRDDWKDWRREQQHEWRRQREEFHRKITDVDPGELVRSIMEQVRGGGRPPAPVPSAPDGTVTIMFSDIVGFTAMTERLGDMRAQAVLRDHNALVRAQLTQWGGHEVKSLGDSFMVAFTSASRALRCAMAIQRSMAAYAVAHPDAPVELRVGLHTGEAIREQDDLFGRTVIVASRIADEAKGSEILVSSLLMQLCESSGEFVFDEGREVTLKGLSQPYHVHALKWEGGD